MMSCFRGMQWLPFSYRGLATWGQRMGCFRNMQWLPFGLRRIGLMEAWGTEGQRTFPDCSPLSAIERGSPGECPYLALSPYPLLAVAGVAAMLRSLMHGLLVLIRCMKVAWPCPCSCIGVVWPEAGRMVRCPGRGFLGETARPAVNIEGSAIPWSNCASSAIVLLSCRCSFLASACCIVG